MVMVVFCKRKTRRVKTKLHCQSYLRCRVRFHYKHIGVRTSQGTGGLKPPDSGKNIIFRAKAKFFGQKPAAKNAKSIFLFYLLNEKNGIHHV